MANTHTYFAYILSVGWDKLTGRLKNEPQARFRARELTNLLVELGPAFVKAGQPYQQDRILFQQSFLKNCLNCKILRFDGDKAMGDRRRFRVKVDEIF